MPALPISAENLEDVAPRSHDKYREGKKGGRGRKWKGTQLHIITQSSWPYIASDCFSTRRPISIRTVCLVNVWEMHSIVAWDDDCLSCYLTSKEGDSRLPIFPWCSKSLFKGRLMSNTLKINWRPRLLSFRLAPRRPRKERTSISFPGVARLWCDKTSHKKAAVKKVGRRQAKTLTIFEVDDR